jgi:hypothetical protein
MVPTPAPGAWSNNLISPITIHDVTAGPYSFAWTSGSYVALPGFANTGFVWDGIRDVGVLYAAAMPTSGGFVARACSQLRHVGITFPPGIAGVGTAGATVPNNPLLLGVAFTAQAGAVSFANPLGLVTSNGVNFVVGY